MDQRKHTVTILIVLLICSTGMAIYGFFSKGKAVPAVSVVFQGNDYSYEHEINYNRVQFWNNYPYWTLLSEGKKLDSTVGLIIKNQEVTSLSTLVTAGPQIFLRLGAQEFDLTLLDTIISTIAVSGVSVKLLVDKGFRVPMLNSRQVSARNPVICVIDSPLKLAIEQAQLPYFFQLGKDMRVQYVYVPRIEIPEMTAKYLARVKELI